MKCSDTSPTLSLTIVTINGPIYSGRACMVELPSASGGLGILPRHAPLLAELTAGEVRIQSAGNDEFIYISGGYAEIQPKMITILADFALRAHEVDEQAALEAKKRAEMTMKTARLFVDRDRAYAELLQALAQLRVLEHSRKRPRGGQ